MYSRYVYKLLTTHWCQAGEPNIYIAMYNISVVDYTMANPGNALGIFEDGDIYDQYDLNLFYKTLTYA